MKEQVVESAKNVLDGAAVSTGVATFLGMLPDIALVLQILSAIWLGLRIWETKTVQKLVLKLFGKK